MWLAVKVFILVCLSKEIKVVFAENLVDNDIEDPVLSSANKEEAETTDSHLLEKEKLKLFLPLSVLHKLENDENESSTPLLLTQLLEEDRFQYARNLSRTQFGNETSYTGFFTVDKICGSHLYFWFFPSVERDWVKAPVLLWLNGGPGASSMFGLFEEIGPWKMTMEGLKNNPHTWTKDHNVLFVDQPVGTGYSFTERGCYAQNITVVAQQMYSTLVQFFTMFPELQKNKFFMTGESHAGHYLPAIAVEIDKRNPLAASQINLIGILVGNPLIDIRCIQTPNFLFELGIIDRREKDKLVEYFRQFELAFKDGNFIRTVQHYSDALAVDLLQGLGLPSIFNILYETGTTDLLTDFLSHRMIKRAVHAGNVTFNLVSEKVNYYFIRDRFTSQASDIQYLLNTGRYTVGFYVGQLDGRCPYSSLPCVLEKLEWPGAQEYISTSRNPWFVSDRLAGWYKVAGNLYEVVVRGSGHFVPIDQGEAALDLVRAAVADTPGTPLLSFLNRTMGL